MNGRLSARLLLLVISLLPVIAMGATDPLLRHDWTWYPFFGNADDVLSRAYSGWHTEGLGSASPLLNAYIIVTALYPLLLTLPRAFVVACVVFAASLGASVGAFRLAEIRGANKAAACAGALFSVANPWFYCELVAGHSFMLLAYASLAMLAYYWLERPRESAWIRAALLCICLSQLQFFVVAFIIEAVVAVRARAWPGIVIGSVIALPAVAGIAADQAGLQAIPYLLPWQQAASIAPKDVLLFLGYGAGYSHVFASGLPLLGMYAIALAAIAGAVVSIRTKPNGSMLAIAIAALLCAIAVTGTKGPLAPLYIAIVLHVRASALFRELYDAVGLLSIAYLIFIPFTLARWRGLTVFYVFSAAVLVVPWARQPPFAWWVNASDLPHVQIDASPNSRFALLPQYQPLSYEGRGAGVDPDAYPRPRNVTPLNEYMPGYPATAAFQEFVSRRNTELLSALSVSEIVNRPYLRTDWRTLGPQMSVPSKDRDERELQRAFFRRIAAFPELSVIPFPAITASPTSFGEGKAFVCDLSYGDESDTEWGPGRNCRKIEAPASQVDAAKGWVDARLAFVANPDLGQPFGGAMTTSRTALLHVSGGGNYLVWIDGVLSAIPGGMAIHGSGGYEWVHIPKTASSLRCEGTCVVAVRARRSSGSHSVSTSRLQPGIGVPFHLITPWLLVCTVYAPRGALRYNVTFDPGWTAFAFARKLRHIRLDGAVNGWLLGEGDAPTTVMVVHVPSAAQFVLAALVMAILAALLGRAAFLHVARRYDWRRSSPL